MGGTILPLIKNINRSSVRSNKMKKLKLVVSPDFNNKAKGFYYYDDGESFDYRQENKYLLGKFEFDNNSLKYSMINANYASLIIIEDIELLGQEDNISSIRLVYIKENDGKSQSLCNNLPEVELNYKFKKDIKAVIVKNTKTLIYCDWQIRLEKNN